ncbi:hypothetical protein ACTMSW_08715 [Micromonospora sp. BQ11]|uniref:hypothetical protein n=1 Tax=Micromonospora sp. BQ11 TaxID=3452212 RepID=UPI003F8AF0AA
MTPKPRHDPLGIPLNIPRDRDVLVDRKNHPVTTGGPAPTKAESDLFLVSGSNHRLEPVKDGRGHTLRFDEKDANGNTLRRGYQGVATVQGADPHNRTQPSGVPLDLRNSQLSGSVTGMPVSIYDAQQRPMQTVPHSSTFMVHGGELLGGPAQPGGTPQHYQVRDDGRLTAATGTDGNGKLQKVTTATDGTVNGRLLEPNTVPPTGFGTQSDGSRKPGGERTNATPPARPEEGSQATSRAEHARGLGPRPPHNANDPTSTRPTEKQQARAASHPAERLQTPSETRPSPRPGEGTQATPRSQYEQGLGPRPPHNANDPTSTRVTEKQQARAASHPAERLQTHSPSDGRRH